MTRVLFIRYKKSNSILDGGEQVAEMHHHALVQLFEKDCVDTYYLHSQDKKRSVLDYLRGVLYFPFNYHFGLTPKKVKKISRFLNYYLLLFLSFVI